MKINASVGSWESGAKNNPADVSVVQELLLDAAREKSDPSIAPNGINGSIHRVGSHSSTVQAILAFQKQYAGMSNPDGRIDVFGGTWKKLTFASLPAQRPIASSEIVTLTVTHGGKIPTKTTTKASASDTNEKEYGPATEIGMYESVFTLSGGLTGTFSGSIYPDSMWVKGRVVDGTYPLHIGFHKGGGKARQEKTDLVAKTDDIRPGLLVNARNSVSVKSDNPTKITSQGINVHNGWNSKRFSDGCLTILPTDWFRFINLFLDAFPEINDWHTVGTNTGKKIGSLVIKQ